MQPVLQTQSCLLDCTRCLHSHEHVQTPRRATACFLGVARPAFRCNSAARIITPLTIFRLVVLAATGVSLPAAIAVALLAALLTAVVAAFFALALIPDRVRQQFDRLHRDGRVVAGD